MNEIFKRLFSPLDQQLISRKEIKKSNHATIETKEGDPSHSLTPGNKHTWSHKFLSWSLIPLHPSKLKQLGYGLRDREIWVRFQEQAIIQRVQIDPEAHLTFYLINNRDLSQGKSARSMGLSTHCHLALTLGISSVIPPLRY